MSDVDIKEEMDMEIGFDSYPQYDFEEVIIKEEIGELQRFYVNDDEDMAIIKDPLSLDDVSKSSTDVTKNLLNRRKPKPKPKRHKRKKSRYLEAQRKKLKKRVICEDCGKVFSGDQILKNHHKDPPSQYGIKCQECNATFKRETCLIYHMEEIHPSYSRLRMPSLYYGGGRKLDRLKCPDCHKVYKQSSAVRRHLEGKSLKINNEPVKCDECNMSFVVSNCLNYHIELKHPKLVPQLIIPSPTSALDPVADILCEECGKSFPKLAYLYHINTYHKDRCPLYSCGVCKKSFDSKDLFCLHKAETTACITVKNIHKCPDCSKTFASKKSVKRHAKIHTTEKEKPSQCEPPLGLSPLTPFHSTPSINESRASPFHSILRTY